MSPYVTDTQGLLWYLGGSPLLGTAARAAFDEAATGSGEASVHAIALGELVSLARKRGSAIDVANIVAALRSNLGFHLTSLSPDLALRTQSLAALADIHDHLIVAEALETGAELISRDRAIRDSGLVRTTWSTTLRRRAIHAGTQDCVRRVPIAHVTATETRG